VGYSTVPASGLPRESQATGPSDTVLWEPSPWLQKVADDGLPATGDGLDLACGSGRNTVYLASLLGPALSGAGALYGVDILPDALAQAREVRERAGLALSAREALSADGTLPAHGTLPAGRTFPAHGTLSTRLPAHFHRADLSSKSGQRRWLPAARWSVIVVFRYLDREILPLIAESLQPGGHLVYETFLEEQRVRRGSPRSDRHLLQPGELPLTFASLETLRYEEGEDEDGNVLASFWARRP
jgi:SAM-dependent methyltransferase